MAKLEVRIINATVLVEATDANGTPCPVHLTVNIAAPGHPPRVDVAMLGPTGLPEDAMKRVAQVIVSALMGTEKADFEPRLVVMPGGRSTP